MRGVILGRRPLTVAEVVAVARGGERVEPADDLDAVMAPSRADVERALAGDRVVYGVTTADGSAVNSNDLLAAIKHPHPTSGAPSTNQQETFAVNALGWRTKRE